MEESEALYESFKAQYAGGCRSPFLYLEACLLLEKKPELLKTIDNFELHVLYYGARKKMIGRIRRCGRPFCSRDPVLSPALLPGDGAAL